MSWPIANDYFEAVQHPLRHFAKPDLKRSQVALDDAGKPRVAKGKWVDVYEMRDVNGVDRWAIGCFTEQPHGMRWRYRQINNHLAEHPLTCLVETTYLDQGISIRGRWFPITSSRWVDGLPLCDWLRKNVGQPHQLQGLADAWLRLVRDLHRAGVAHGNLCSDTILVATEAVPGVLNLKLVDYDAIHVPTLEQSLPEEIGHADYQHPQRVARGWYHADVDRFPQLLIYTALQALAAGGRSLWEKYDRAGNLLFRAPDLQEPATSAVFRDLWRSQHGRVRDLAGYLILAAQNDVEKVPALEPLVDKVQSAVGNSTSARSSLTDDQVRQIEALMGDGPAGAAGTDLDLVIDDDKPGEDHDPFALEVEDEPDPSVAGSGLFAAGARLLGTNAANLPPPLPVLPARQAIANPNRRSFTIEAWMPEQVAVLKLQGFVKEAGGQIVESVPGLIRVHLLDEVDLAQSGSASGLLGWLGLVEQPAAAPRVVAVMDLDLAHKADDSRPRLLVTVSLTPGPDQQPSLSWTAYCERLFCELRGFLIGK
jgi:hypothetical protein